MAENQGTSGTQGSTNTAIATVKRSGFSELLGAIGDGTLEQDLSDIVIQLSDAMREHGGTEGKSKGSIKLMIKFNYDRGLVDVDSDLAVVEPKVKRTRTVLWPVPGRGLSRSNPQQIDAFKDVPMAQPEPPRSLSIARDIR